MNELIYRPQHKDEQELKEDFVIRILEFKKLMNSIRTDQMGKVPQHIIMQGRRGMGKTTLMYRVFYEVQKDFRKIGLVPVIFGEEQYSVRTLYKLWEQIARFLEDNEKEYSGLWFEMQNIMDEEDYEDKCFELLQRSVKKNNHRLLLLIDNFGMMIDKFSKKEQQRLREVLTTFPEIKIIGGSAMVLESFFKYDKPFFDFFKIINLGPLNSIEVRKLLLRLGEKHNTEKIKEIISNQPGRIESLRILAGGVPRTIVLLFNIFLDDDHGNSIDDLKKLLDLVTPLYKHRMDELPSQQQEIVDKLALNWDGMSVAELVKKTRMESKAISAQLNNLVKNGIISTEKSTGKNKFYQLEERFFNIWYLMQHAPLKSQRRVIWLTRFLELWCNEKMLNDEAMRFTKRVKQEVLQPEFVKTLTSAYARAFGLSQNTRDELIETARIVLNNHKLEAMEDMPLTFSELDSKFEYLLKENKFNQAKSLIESAYLQEEIYDIMLAIINVSSGNLGEAEINLKRSAKKGNGIAIYNLAVLNDDYYKDYLMAEKYYLMAVKKDVVEAMNNLGILYENIFKDHKKAEKYFLIARKHGYKFASANLVNLYIRTNNLEHQKKTENLIKELIQADPDSKLELLYILYLLWTNEPELATQKFESLLPEIIDKDELYSILTDILAFAIAKGLKAYIFKLFNRENLQLKDRFKVVYYALMKILEEEYPNEIIKMGKELTEPVNEMLEYIHKLELKYR